MTTDEAIVHHPNFDERAHFNQQSQTMNCYEKPFEIRVDEIDVNGHLHHTKYLEYCSHTRYCQLDWRLVRSQAPPHRGPPPQLGAVTDAIRSRDSTIL